VISFGFAPVGRGARRWRRLHRAGVARRNAREHGGRVREELMRLVVHGVLARARPRSSGRRVALRLGDVAAAGASAADAGGGMNARRSSSPPAPSCSRAFAAAADGALLGGDPDPEPSPPVVGGLAAT
jgi:hypothetical protein